MLRIVDHVEIDGDSDMFLMSQGDCEAVLNNTRAIGKHRVLIGSCVRR